MVPGLGLKGVEMVLASLRPKRLTSLSMYTFCDMDSVHTALLYLTSRPRSHFISPRSETSNCFLNSPFTQFIDSIVLPEITMSSVEMETTDENSPLCLKNTA